MTVSLKVEDFKPGSYSFYDAPTPPEQRRLEVLVLEELKAKGFPNKSGVVLEDFHAA